MIEPLLARYNAHLDGEWEHRNGFKVETADNPGLIVTLDPGGDLGPDRVIEDRYAMRVDRFAHPASDGEPIRGLVWSIRVHGGTLIGFCELGQERALIVRLIEVLEDLT